MTMISPQDYAENLKNKSYEELIKHRDKLIREIRLFEKQEKDKIHSHDIIICPTPDVVYKMNLEYLASLCMLMSSEYNVKN